MSGALGRGGAPLRTGGIGGSSGTGGYQFPSPVNGGYSAPQYTAPPVTSWTSNATRDPYLDESYQDARAYAQALGRNEDAYAQGAMARQRDSTTGAVNEFLGASAGRGLYGTGAAAQGTLNLMQSGQRASAGLNFDLAQGGRRQQLAAIGTQGQIAGQSAADLRAQDSNSLNAWQAVNNANYNAASLAANQQQMWFNQQMAMLNSPYTPGTGNGFGGWGSGGASIFGQRINNG